MRAEEEVASAAGRLAQGADEALAMVERFEGKLPCIEGGIWAHGVELDGGEALLDVGDGALGGEQRVAVGVGGVARVGVEIGIGGQPLVDAAAEQLQSRVAQLLAGNGPTRHLRAAEAAE